MQQKTKHHLEFLVDRVDRNARMFSLGASRAGSFAPSNVQPSPAPAAQDDDDAMDEDAEGEEDDTEGMKGSKTKGGMVNGAAQVNGTSNGEWSSGSFRARSSRMSVAVCSTRLLRLCNTNISGRSRSRSFRDGSQAGAVEGEALSKVLVSCAHTSNWLTEVTIPITRRLQYQHHTGRHQDSSRYERVLPDM